MIVALTQTSLVEQVKHVGGSAGTTVHLTFRNPRTDETYAIMAQRHGNHS